VLSTETDCQES